MSAVPLPHAFPTHVMDRLRDIVNIGPCLMAAEFHRPRVREALAQTEILIAAVLDVTDPEPLPADSPLLDLPDVYLTPHIAGAPEAMRPRAWVSLWSRN
ncbi:hypothetical protein SATRM34S_00237 [Streptomyces atroolivaceus]